MAASGAKRPFIRKRDLVCSCGAGPAATVTILVLGFMISNLAADAKLKPDTDDIRQTDLACDDDDGG
jgi:hypothetical protein